MMFFSQMPTLGRGAATLIGSKICVQENLLEFK